TFTTPQGEQIIAKKDLGTFINQRTTGNDVIKFEIDYYTGSQYYMATNSAPGINIGLYDNNNKGLLNFYHRITQNDYIHCTASDGFSLKNAVYLSNGYDPLP